MRDMKNKLANFLFASLFMLAPLLHSAPATAEDPEPNILLDNCGAGQMCAGKATWQGNPRTFHFYLPPAYKASTTNLPLILVLHDNENSALDFQQNILKGSFEAKTATEGVILVYPDAMAQKWSFSPDSPNAAIDDVGFLSQLTDYFLMAYRTNKYKIYAAGMGTGGMMAMRFACESPVKITAIATVMAAMPASIARTCKPARATSLLMINGRNDVFLPWNSNRMFDLSGASSVLRLTVPQTFYYWLKVTHNYGVPVFVSVPINKYDGTWVWKESAVSVHSIAELFTIYGSGHNWPGQTPLANSPYNGKTSYNLDTTTTIWEFFLRMYS